MIPPWFRALVALQLAGLGVLVGLAVHMLGTGSHASGRVVPWASPATPAPNVAQPQLHAPSPTRSASLPDIRAAAPDLLRRLNHDTAALATGEYALLLQLEAVIRDQITELATHPPRGS